MKKIFIFLSFIIVAFLSLPLLKLILVTSMNSYIQTLNDTEVIHSIL